MSAPSERESGRNRVPPESFILKSAQQEEALHRIWYALKSLVLHRLCTKVSNEYIVILHLQASPFLLCV
ncbi:unnamed protein product [Spirodela intermedia]|uniref:Uncharacterized protein n=1 Tax=Spirodela intermedia TaxID=51605 RepID=A0A7I8L6F9_SPIIN|nr:unnamed protein product [Spirodela intermedia]